MLPTPRCKGCHLPLPCLLLTAIELIRDLQGKGSQCSTSRLGQRGGGNPTPGDSQLAELVFPCQQGFLPPMDAPRLMGAPH